MNRKCLIGAIILSPVVSGLLLVAVWGFAFLVSKIPYIPEIFFVIIIVGLMVSVGIILYQHCKEWRLNHAKMQRECRKSMQKQGN